MFETTLASSQTYNTFDMSRNNLGLLKSYCHYCPCTQCFLMELDLLKLWPQLKQLKFLFNFPFSMLKIEGNVFSFIHTAPSFLQKGVALKIRNGCSWLFNIQWKGNLKYISETFAIQFTAQNYKCRICSCYT